MSRWIYVRRGLGIAIVIGSVYFLSRHIALGWEALSRFAFRVNLPLLGASVALQIAVLIFGVWIWSRVLTHFSDDAVRASALLRVWSVANLARYVPGSIWQLVLGSLLAEREGLSRRLLFFSLAVQMALSVLGASAVVVLLGSLSSLTALNTAPLLQRLHAPWICAACITVLIGSVHPRLITRGLQFLARLTRQIPPAWRGSWPEGFRLLLLMTANWLASGFSFWLFVAALVDLPTATWRELGVVHALSFLAGYLVIVAPAGLGVRESSIALLLSSQLPLGVSALLAVLARLWSIAAELGTVAVALALGFRPLAQRRLDDVSSHGK
jgi:hypothetical protein